MYEKLLAAIQPSRNRATCRFFAIVRCFMVCKLTAQKTGPKFAPSCGEKRILGSLVEVIGCIKTRVLWWNPCWQSPWLLGCKSWGCNWSQHCINLFSDWSECLKQNMPRKVHELLYHVVPVTMRYSESIFFATVGWGCLAEASFGGRAGGKQLAHPPSAGHLATSHYQPYRWEWLPDFRSKIDKNCVSDWKEVSSITFEKVSARVSHSRTAMHLVGNSLYSILHSFTIQSIFGVLSSRGAGHLTVLGAMFNWLDGRRSFQRTWVCSGLDGAEHVMWWCLAANWNDAGS